MSFPGLWCNTNVFWGFHWTIASGWNCNKGSLRSVWEQRAVLDKSKKMESLERTRKQGHREVHQLVPPPQPVNKDCIFMVKIRCSFLSSPLCNYKYFSPCNFASVLQCSFLITISIWSDTIVLICVMASTCDVCPSVCQVICAEKSWTYGLKYLGLL